MNRTVLTVLATTRTTYEWTTKNRIPAGFVNRFSFAVVLAVVFETPTRLLARVRPRYLHCGVDAPRDGALEQCVSTIDTCLDKVVVLCWVDHRRGCMPSKALPTLPTLPNLPTLPTLTGTRKS